MKLLLVVASGLVLTGCAASLQNPSKSFAEQKADRARCEAQASGSKVTECMIAMGYSKPKVEAFPFEG
jgi:hypothetical protein